MISGAKMVLDRKYIDEWFEFYERHGLIRRFFENVVVRGKENINNKRQKVIVANHLSHTDYALLQAVFLRMGLEPLRFAAGKNLDLPFLSKIGLDLEKWGAFWIDRVLIEKGDRSEKTQHLQGIERFVISSLNKGQSIAVFPEGGRNYNGDVMSPDKIKNGIFNYLCRKKDGNYIKDPGQIDVVPLAFHYSPRRVEEPFFSKLKEYRKKYDKSGRRMYYLYDGAAFLWHPLSRLLFMNRHVQARLSFGEPIKLEEGGQSIKAHELKDRMIRDIRQLYEELQGRDYQKSSRLDKGYEII